MLQFASLSLLIFDLSRTSVGSYRSEATFFYHMLLPRLQTLAHSNCRKLVGETMLVPLPELLLALLEDFIVAVD